MKLVIIDYGSGNLRSAAKAFERVIRESELPFTVGVESSAAAVAAADYLVLPGVGAFADCRAGLFALPGVPEALNRAVIGEGRPFFGICVGMQLMATSGLEDGSHPGFDWIPGVVDRLAPRDAKLKIPHMGWNQFETVAAHPVFAGIHPGDHAYFVHSYGLRPKDPAMILATVDYGGSVVAAVGRDNMVGSQFHPEKSQATGLKILGNFLRWRP